ncbi:MAG: hypothetical protein U0637_01120 [Phycisphaerales bacterium]
MPEQTPQSSPDLRSYLASRDVPCARCGYNLKGLTGDRCTECGARVELGVHPARGRWSAIALVVITCGWPLTSGAMNACREVQSAVYVAQYSSSAFSRLGVAQGALPTPSVVKSLFQQGYTIYFYLAMCLGGLAGISWLLLSRNRAAPWPGRALCRYAIAIFSCHAAWHVSVFVISQSW